MFAHTFADAQDEQQANNQMIPPPPISTPRTARLSEFVAELSKK